MDKNFYNQSSATQLGWEPTWFGERYFDEMLVRAIKKFQKAYGLISDGLCGPSTFRRVWTERQSKIDEFKPSGDPYYSDYIVFNSRFYPIEWDKVVLWSEEGGLSARPGTYYNYSGRAERSTKLFVNHWDACLSSHSCQRVLDRRNLSVHFLIDNDGTIYQTLDMQHGAWHAGNINRKAIGVEISNAFYTKYQDTYIERGHGPRPIIESAAIHGNEIGPFLDFYPIQITALKTLWKAVHIATGIPYQTPLDQYGKTSTKYEQDAAYGKFTGFISHYHVSKNKQDCAGLDTESLIQEIVDSD